MKNILFILLLANIISAQSFRQTRAVYVATNFHLDFPSLTYNADLQRKELKEIFSEIKNKNFNAVFFQVRSQGTVFYHSEYEPASPYLTGKIGAEPDYDVLGYAIKTARELGLEIHAWVNVFRCLSGSDLQFAENNRHVMKKHPDWAVKYRHNGEVSYWLDPGMPEVRDYLSDIIAEIAMNYDLDGIHLDFVRYPGKNFDDDYTYSLYAERVDKDNWRRENINKFIESVSVRVKRIKPYLKLGAAPLGIYKDHLEGGGNSGFSDVYQDAPLWLKNKWLDYVSPQIYWANEDYPNFSQLAEEWGGYSSERNILLGIGVYKPKVKNQLNEILNAARSLNTAGVAFYRYSDIKTLRPFQSKSLPAKMPWLEGKNISNPLNLTVFYPNDSPDEFSLEWQKPENTSNINYYALFKINGGVKLYSLIRPDKNYINIRIKEPQFSVYKFALKSVDRLWNESKNFSDTVTVNIPGLRKLKKRLLPFKNPVLTKETSDKYKIILFSNYDDEIEVFSSENNKNNLILKQKILAGENIISVQNLPINGNFIFIKFRKNNKQMKLKI